MAGKGIVKRWLKTQSTIALSPGEAELTGIGAGMAQALGLQSLAKDMHWPFESPGALRCHRSDWEIQAAGPWENQKT